jgi:hypothetical protein
MLITIKELNMANLNTGYYDFSNGLNSIYDNYTLSNSGLVNNNPSFLDTYGGYFKVGLDSLNALNGLANSYLGYKNYQLSKNAFNYQKALANRNLANTVSTINTQLDSKTGIGNGLAGTTLTDEEKAQNRADTTSRHLDGSSIG